MINTYSKINNICLVILATVALTVGLIYTRTILVPFVFALFIYSILSPVLYWLKNTWHLPKLIAILLVWLAFLAGFTLIAFFIFNSVDNFVKEAGQYRDKFKEFIEWVFIMAQKWDVNLDKGSVQQFINGLPLMDVASDFTKTLFSILGKMALISIFVIFLIAGGDHQKGENPLMDELHAKISRYVATKFSTSLATGVLVGVLLFSFNVDLAFMFAVITFFLNFIPSVGSIIATMVPLPVLILQFGMSWEVPVIFSLSSSVQIGIGNILEPKIMGEGMDLHPISILLFLTFWGLVWGVPGMFLAVPITAIMKIVMARIKTTRPFAELLAGRLSGPVRE